MKPGLRAILLAVSSASLLAAGCAMMEPRAERYVAPPLGSTWTSDQRNTGSYGAGNRQVHTRRGEKMWQGQQVVTFEGTDATIIALPGTGRWAGFFKGDTPLVTWDPPVGWEWPLEVGKSWTKDYTVTMHAAKRSVPFNMTQKVEAYEDVTVPAGTFKTFKVSTKDTLGNDNIAWFSPELGIFVKQSLRRTEKHAAGPGTREAELASHTISR
jgi:hypothetical protein